MTAIARTARLYASARIAAGVALTAAPQVASPWLTDSRGLTVVRLLGVRDVVLGARALANPAAAGWRRTMLWCAAVDAADAVAAAQRARLGHRRARFAVVAGAIGCAAGLALAAVGPDTRR